MLGGPSTLVFTHHARWSPITWCTRYVRTTGCLMQRVCKKTSHAAKASKAVKQQLGLQVFPWVGQSPDLNPIENAWEELERRLRARPTAPKNKDELFAAL